MSLQLRLIDYDYIAFNPRAYDFANFFLECAFDNFAQASWLLFFMFAIFSMGFPSRLSYKISFFCRKKLQKNSLMQVT